MLKRECFFLAVFLLPGVLLAQETAGSQKIYLDLNSGLPVVENSFTQTWQPKPSVHANIRVPFYRGQIEAGLRYIRFNSEAPIQTDADFHSLFIHLGYSYPIQITPHFQIGPTIRFGNNLMLFDQPKTYTSGSFRYVTDPTESEFAYEFALRNQYQLSRSWAVHATISYNRTLTQFPIPLTMVSAGLSYAFSQPQWLKKLLQ